MAKRNMDEYEEMGIVIEPEPGDHYCRGCESERFKNGRCITCGEREPGRAPTGGPDTTRGKG